MRKPWQIRALSKGDRPFFLHLAFTAPHYPLQAPPEDIARYRGRYRGGYAVLREERYRRMIELKLISKDWSFQDLDLRRRHHHADDRALVGADQTEHDHPCAGACRGPDADLSGMRGRGVSKAIQGNGNTADGRHEFETSPARWC